MNRLGLNKGRYHGEALNVAEYLDSFHAAALQHHWQPQHIATIDHFKLHGYRRPATSASPNSAPPRHIYISTGMHGDEPAGPVALRQLIEENLFPQDVDITLCPCINPTGLALKTRENKNGADLNRDYRSLQTEEVRAHTNWLQSLPNFDLTLILHEDWESDGYYLYEVNPNSLPSPAQRIIEAVREICPIQPDTTIDEMWKCQNGIIHPHLPPLERPLWAEAVYLIVNKTKLSLTLEAPSDFPLPFRAQAHLRALHSAIPFL